MTSVQLRLAEAGVSEVRLEAELLLCHILRTDRTRLYALLDATLTPAEERRLEVLLTRRLRREPLAYILGVRWFYGLEFAVRPGVLIPRPETELLVERAIALAGDKSLSIADIGTGCGNIAVALAVHLTNAHLTATDISPLALQVAAENAVRHRVARRVTLLQGDLLAPLSRSYLRICPESGLPHRALKYAASPHPNNTEPRGVASSSDKAPFSSIVAPLYNRGMGDSACGMAPPTRSDKPTRAIIARRVQGTLVPCRGPGDVPQIYSSSSPAGEGDQGVEVSRLGTGRTSGQQPSVGGARGYVERSTKPVDMIVANLPYVRRNMLPSLQPELSYEPLEALDGGADGLDLLRRLLVQAPAYLAPGGWLLAELDPWQAEEASALARASFEGARVQIERDLAGRERLLVVST